MKQKILSVSSKIGNKENQNQDKYKSALIKVRPAQRRRAEPGGETPSQVTFVYKGNIILLLIDIIFYTESNTFCSFLLS